MDWGSYLNSEQRIRYESMAKGGAIAMVKRDILLEGVRDVQFVYEVHSWFSRNSGDSTYATPFTAKVIAELLAQGLVSLATWSQTKKGDVVPIQKTDEELVALVAQLDELAPSYLLAPTARGREWIARYNTLLKDLERE